jgi:hypothetical protein
MVVENMPTKYRTSLQQRSRNLRGMALHCDLERLTVRIRPVLGISLGAGESVRIGTKIYQGCD